MKNPNFWTWSDSEIISALEGHGCDCPEPFERKAAIALLKEAEDKAIAEGVENTKTYIDELKAAKPELKLIKVIFHSLGEQDIPYVYVGHNGAGFYLPKEVELEVPDFIMKSCIKDAVEDRLMPKVGVDGKINWITRKVQRFPYSIVDF